MKALGWVMLLVCCPTLGCSGLGRVAHPNPDPRTRSTLQAWANVWIEHRSQSRSWPAPFPQYRAHKTGGFDTIEFPLNGTSVELWRTDLKHGFDGWCGEIRICTTSEGSPAPRLIVASPGPNGFFQTDLQRALHDGRRYGDDNIYRVLLSPSTGQPVTAGYLPQCRKTMFASAR